MRIPVSSATRCQDLGSTARIVRSSIFARLEATGRFGPKNMNLSPKCCRRESPRSQLQALTLLCIDLTVHLR